MPGYVCVWVDLADYHPPAKPLPQRFRSGQRRGQLAKHDEGLRWRLAEGGGLAQERDLVCMDGESVHGVDNRSHGNLRAEQAHAPGDTHQPATQRALGPEHPVINALHLGRGRLWCRWWRMRPASHMPLAARMMAPERVCFSASDSSIPALKRR